ncbi:MAG: lamin tail domain-containing protein, partial [Planctomycetota bacterium]
MLSILLAAAAFAPQGPGTSLAPVVINEFCYDDGGTDNYEFVELYNRMPTPVDISGWKVVCRDSASPTFGGAGADPTQTIPAGTILAPGAFYLLGNVALVPTPVLGISQTMPINSIENGAADTIELWDTTNAIIDSVALEMGGQLPFGPFPIEGPGFYGDYATGDAPFGPRSSMSRSQDGFDNDNNTGDFNGLSVPTIGFTNAVPAGLPYADNFDFGTIGSDILGFADGFPPPSYVDPTQITSQNPTAKPASPQGGLAMSFWDVTGGGNAHAAPVGSVADVVVDTYAYFEGPMTPTNPQFTPYAAGNPAYAVG